MDENVCLRNITVFARPQEPSRKYAGELRDALRRSGVFKVVKPDSADLIVLIGGDGFLLGAVRKYAHFGKPFLGINFGDVGFFMNPRIEPHDFLKMLQGPVKSFEIQEYDLLQASFRGENGEAKQTYAFNEIMIERVGGQSLHLDIEIDGKMLNVFSGDGVMAATSQGTTGYAINVGAPAVHLDVKCMTVVPFAPQKSWKYRSLLIPLVLPSTSVVVIRNRSPQKRPARIVSDGRRLGEIVEVTIRFGNRKVSVLRFSDPSLRADYVTTLVDKIIGPSQ